MNKATPDRTPELYPFKALLLGRKGYLARKAWVTAALMTSGGPGAVPPPPDFLTGWKDAVRTTAANSEVTPELKDVLAALEMSDETWFRSGAPLIEDATNPYLVCCREPQVVERPWILRDALAELLKRAGEDVPESDLTAGDPEVTDEEEERLLEGSEDDEEKSPSKGKAKKWQFNLPKMELRTELVREIRRFLRTDALSKKRLQQGGYRWLINEILIRKYVWPMNREVLGLSRACNPHRPPPSPMATASTLPSPAMPTAEELKAAAYAEAE